MTIKNLDLFAFESYVGFWLGAQEVWESLTEEQKAEVNDIADEMKFSGFEEVNDFVEFSVPEILEIDE